MEPAHDSLERLVPDMLAGQDDTGLSTLELHLARYEFAARHLRPGRALDIACGVGYGTRVLADRSGCEVLGVDVSEAAIDYARKRYGGGRVSFRAADAMRFDDPGGFDSIVSLETVEHLPDPDAFLARLVALLRSGGVLVASVPTTPSVDLNPHHLHDFTERSFRGRPALRALDEIDCLRQVQRVHLGAVLSRREKRMADIRASLPAYPAPRRPAAAGRGHAAPRLRQPLPDRGLAEAVLKTIVIPAYQEASRLPALLEHLARQVPDFAIVVVDDGSRDGTARVAAAGGARVLRHPFNLGYGAALQTGYKYALRAGAELVVQMDADGQHEPRDVPALVAPVAEGALDLVVGSRFLGAGDYRMGPLRSAGRAFFRSLLRLFGLRVTDPTSGFQAMNRAVLELYASDMFPSDYPDVDVLLCAHRHGLRIGERPVSMRLSPRASTLHSGLAPIYYVYKMLLSVWAASSTRPGAGREVKG